MTLIPPPRPPLKCQQPGSQGLGMKSELPHVRQVPCHLSTVIPSTFFSFFFFNLFVCGRRGQLANTGSPFTLGVLEIKRRSSGLAPPSLAQRNHLPTTLTLFNNINVSSMAPTALHRHNDKDPLNLAPFLCPHLSQPHHSKLHKTVLLKVLGAFKLYTGDFQGAETDR